MHCAHTHPWCKLCDIMCMPPRCGGPELKATQKYPAAFAERVVTLWEGAPPWDGVMNTDSGPICLPDEMPESLNDQWLDGDMHRVSAFLCRAYTCKPW